jgi:hypothetical protein
VKQAVTSRVQTYDTDFCYAGIQVLDQWWDKWLNVNDDYVEVWCVPSATHAPKSAKKSSASGYVTFSSSFSS